MNDFGNSLDVVKGALICGRSPHYKRGARRPGDVCSARTGTKCRPPRGTVALRLQWFRYGETPARTAASFTCMES